MPILITGGAGYIGSHTVKYFQKQNEEIIVVDNMQSGHEASIDVEHLYKIDIRNNVHFKNYIRSTISPHCGTSNYWRADLSNLI